MSTATVTPPPAANPTPAAPRMTAEEFGRKYDGQRVEYVNGHVKELPMPGGGKHGIMCGLVAYYLIQYALANNSGRVFSNDTFLKTPVKEDPERVYGPDVFFVGYDRLPKDAEVPTGTVTVLPQLVVEVRSPSDTWGYVFGKVGSYLQAGVQVVVVVDFETRTASAYRDTSPPQQIFSATDELTVPDVLPGFAVPVAALFA